MQEERRYFKLAEEFRINGFNQSLPMIYLKIAHIHINIGII